MSDTTASMADVHKYFAGGVTPDATRSLTQGEKDSYPLAKFRTDWQALSDEDKMAFRKGLGDGTLTY